MPDWSYRTALRPLMLAAGPERSRRLATATLRTLSRIPFGLKLIDFLGHMAPDPRLRTRAGATELRGPISLGPLIDPRGDALPAFSRFGVGLIEVGPVAERGSDATPEWTVDVKQRTITAVRPVVAGIDDVLRNLERMDPRVPVCVHLAEDNAALIARLKPHASMFVLPDGVISDGANAIGMWMRGDAAGA
jgi:dihydroorotate dehydrogenase